MPTKPDQIAEGTTSGDADALMRVRDLKVHYALRAGMLSRLFGLGTGPYARSTG